MKERDRKLYADYLNACKEPHTVKRLHFISAPATGVCAVTGRDILYGEICIEKVLNDGRFSWYHPTSETFKWWVTKRTKLDLDRAQKGLCEHGALVECEKCREITPGWQS